MAILFTSPKIEKRIVFWSTSILVIIILAVIFLIAFPPDLINQQKLNPLDVIVPEIKINFDILNSNKVKNLESFSIIVPQSENIGRGEPFFPYFQSTVKK